MKKYVLYGFLTALAVCVIALVVYFVNPGVETIKSGTFDVKEWNTPEFIEANTFTVHDGIVLRQMESDTPELFDCIIEVNSNTGEGKTYLVYYVDTTEHHVGDKVEDWTGVWAASYNYEETIDMVRRIPVYLSTPAIELLQKK